MSRLCCRHILTVDGKTVFVCQCYSCNAVSYTVEVIFIEGPLTVCQTILPSAAVQAHSWPQPVVNGVMSPSGGGRENTPRSRGTVLFSSGRS